MTDFVQTIRADGSEERVATSEIGLLARPVIQTVFATSYALNAGHHGKILNFTSASAVTVSSAAEINIIIHQISGSTVGSFSLDRFAWSCCFTFGTFLTVRGQVTLSASGTTIHETDAQFATAGAHVMLTLMAFSADVFTLYGKTA